MVLPGEYRLELTVDGKTFNRTLVVKLDPRLVGVSQADLKTQLVLEQALGAQLEASTPIYAAMQAEVEHAGKQKAEMEGIQHRLGLVNMNQARMLSGLEQADGAPGSEVTEVVRQLCGEMVQAVHDWDAVAGVKSITAPACRGDEDISSKKEKQ